MTTSRAIAAIEQRALADREQSESRWRAIIGDADLDRFARSLKGAGRLTVNFHPDRISRHGRSVAAGLHVDGRYRSQWSTGISSGSRSAVVGGERERFERELFDGAYDDTDRASIERPIYGALDLLWDPHGGSPRFGSCFLVLRRHVMERTTLSLGDSHLAPRDVGTTGAPWSILAGLAEQAGHRALLGRALGIDALLAAIEGAYRSGRAGRELDGYVEAQVHGGLDLEHDVEAVVVDPSFRETPIERDLSEAAHRYGFVLTWHAGSRLHVDEVPDDFRGPAMPALARRVADTDGYVDAHRIGLEAARLPFVEPSNEGDHPESELQQLKYLWHTLLARGRDATV